MAVKRLVEGLGSIASHHLLIEPDFGVGRSLRHEVFTNMNGELVHLLVKRTHAWVGTAHDISVDITASSDRVESSSVDLLNGRLQVDLDDTVELESLTCGELEGVIASCVGDVIDRAPLFRLANTSWHTHSDHEGVSWLKALILALFSDITVVLLVDTCTQASAEFIPKRHWTYHGIWSIDHQTRPKPQCLHP